LALTIDAYECAQRLTDFNYRLLLSVLDIRLRRLCGELDGPTMAIAELRRAVGRGTIPNAGLIALIEAQVVLAGGRARGAVPLLRDAAARLDEVDFGGLSASAHFLLAEALALTGDVPAAVDHQRLGTGAEDRTLDVFRPEQSLAKRWVHVAAGNRKLASAAFDDAARRAGEQGQQLVEVHVHHAGVRLGDRSAARRLAAVAPAVEGPFASSAAMHAAALLGADRPLLLRAASGFAQQGALAEAADAVAQAARQAERSGDRSESLRLAARASTLAASAGGLDTPALRAVVAAFPLTRRQRDVARLAASGLSNRDIAERLAVGIRTVESHLDAAYRRLGIQNRSELAGLFPAHPEAPG